MNRLKRELISRGIVFEGEDCDGYGAERKLVAITEKYIITVFGCNVLPAEIHLFDHSFNLIGTQNLLPERKLFGNGMTWCSVVCGTVLQVYYGSAFALLAAENPVAYTCGVYGWNADVYDFGDVAIVTGYRPFGKKVDGEIVRKYEKAAREIRRDHEFGYPGAYMAWAEQMHALVQEFIDKATGREVEA